MGFLMDPFAMNVDAVLQPELVPSDAPVTTVPMMKRYVMAKESVGLENLETVYVIVGVFQI
jgi:hypothetical protein